MNDFIFGTLATEELRRARSQSLRSGVVHQFNRQPRDPRPSQPVRLTLTAGPRFAGQRAWVYWTEDGSEPVGAGGKAQNGSVLPLQLESTLWDVELWGYLARFTVDLPGFSAKTVVRYRLSLEVYGAGEVFADGGALHAFFVDDDPLPEWTRHARVYHIFVDRFNPGAGSGWKKPDNLLGFYGGRIAGVTEKLDYIQDMGFNTLWLSPIFPSPSHHGYDASDLFEVEPRLGSKADLRHLLDDAHQRGMRVLLDFVPNHWSNLHPTFQQALTVPDSPFRDWYTFYHWPDDYEAFFGVKELPQVNLRNPAARQYMLDAVRYWLEFGADGYRLDYAIGPVPDFWADFRRVSRSVKPDCWTFGEIVDPSDVQLGFAGQIDGSLDFMLLEALRQATAFGNWDGAQLAGFLERHEAYFPEDFSRLSFIDNHDMNRFLWAAGGDKRRLRLAALCQFTLSGPPVVYYGTEVGLSQERDVRQDDFGKPEEARLPMPWEPEAQDVELAVFYRCLTAQRQHHACLIRGEFAVVQAGRDTLVYARALPEERCIVALNLSAESQSLQLAVDCNHLLLATDSACKMELLPNQVCLDLPPFSGVLIR